MLIVILVCWLKSGYSYGTLLPECRPTLDGLSLAQPLALVAAYKIYDSGFYHSSIWMLLGAVALMGAYLGRIGGGLASFMAALVAGLLAALPWLGLHMTLGQLNSALEDGTRVEIRDLLALSEASRDLQVTLNLTRAEYVIKNASTNPHAVSSVRWSVAGGKLTSSQSPGAIRPMASYTGKLAVALKDPVNPPHTAHCILGGTVERVPKLPLFLEVRF